MERVAKALIVLLNSDHEGRDKVTFWRWEMFWVGLLEAPISNLIQSLSVSIRTPKVRLRSGLLTSDFYMPMRTDNRYREILYSTKNFWIELVCICVLFIQSCVDHLFFMVIFFYFFCCWYDLQVDILLDFWWIYSSNLYWHSNEAFCLQSWNSSLLSTSLILLITNL